MRFEDYRRHDMTALAELVARREVSAAELLETALARSAAVNPQINAITQDLSDFARGELAQASEGPFAGVPFLLKDLGAQLAGTVTTGGSRAFKDARAEADSAIVAAYRRAGLVIFGKTNTPEFGLAPVTEPALFGASRNPWNLDHTPGGSSGGASAAVAAGRSARTRSSSPPG